MIAFDTDVLSLILRGNSDCIARCRSIRSVDQFVPVVVIEESMRGWLNAIRSAETKTAFGSVSVAYASFERCFIQLRKLQLLSGDEQQKEGRDC